MKYLTNTTDFTETIKLAQNLAVTKNPIVKCLKYF